MWTVWRDEGGGERMVMDDDKGGSFKVADLWISPRKEV